MNPKLDLSGLPWFVGQLIVKTISNPRCTPDHVLLMADALEEQAAELPAQTIYRDPCERVVRALRDLAAHFTRGPGKPFGDFDGTLTP